MFFKSIRLHNFRNYSELALGLNPAVNIFVGYNGQGKTNLVEAIHIAVKGDSFRHGQPDTWLRKIAGGHCDQSLISARVDKNGLESEIQIRCQMATRKYLIDGKRTSAHSLKESFPAVLFSPESLSAIKEGPEQRRLLVDDVIQSLGGRDGHRVAEFRRALKSRNRLLRDFHSGVYNETQLNALLEAFDEVYLPLAATLTLARITTLKALLPHLQKAVQFISPKDLVDISVDYEISGQSAVDWDLHQILDSLRNRLKSLRNSEIQSATTLVGPHKHEVNFLSAGNDARYFCSQGQQRTLILGFKMAQIMYHYTVFQIHPLLLLDDVLSELDPQKGANLLKFLESIRSQILLTTTDISFPFEFGRKDMTLFRLSSGAVEELRP